MTREEKKIISSLTYHEMNYLQDKLDEAIEEQRIDNEFKNDRELYIKLWGIYQKCGQAVGILPIIIKDNIKRYESQG